MASGDECPEFDTISNRSTKGSERDGSHKTKSRLTKRQRKYLETDQKDGDSRRVPTASKGLFPRNEKAANVSNTSKLKTNGDKSTGDAYKQQCDSNRETGRVVDADEEFSADDTSQTSDSDSDAAADELISFTNSDSESTETNSDANLSECESKSDSDADELKPFRNSDSESTETNSNEELSECESSSDVQLEITGSEEKYQITSEVDDAATNEYNHPKGHPKRAKVKQMKKILRDESIKRKERETQLRKNDRKRN